MTLQAQEINLADTQETWIVRPVWPVATGASFSLHGYVLIYKGPLLVGVAFQANVVSAGKSPDLSQGGCTVNVVAVAAADEAFIHAVVIRLGEICLGRSVASIAEIRLCSDQQMLGFLRIMWRMAIDAAHIIVVV